jgi:hypothetical protein
MQCSKRSCSITGVGELLELPRHVKAKHLRGFHID